MAFDGITIANIVKELNETIVGGKINKIAQPEADELILTIKNNRTQYRLLISASASLPLIYFYGQEQSKPSHSTEFLYAAAQACGKRQDHGSDPAGTGACH